MSLLAAAQTSLSPSELPRKFVQVFLFIGVIMVVWVNTPLAPALGMTACLVLPGLRAVLYERDGDGFLLEFTGGLGIFTLPVQILFLIVSALYRFG